MRPRFTWLFAGAIGASVLAVAAATGAAAMTGTVVGVVDGDTIRVRIAGRVRTVRMVGIDAPATRRQLRVAQCHGSKVAGTARALLPPGSRVRLVTDPIQVSRDRRRYLLAYVYVGHRSGARGSVNYALIARGAGRAHRPALRGFRYARAFLAAEAKARKARRGLWGSPCRGRITAPLPPARREAPTPVPPPAAAAVPCDPNDSGACPPPPPPAHGGLEITTGEILGPPFERRMFYVRRGGSPWAPTYADGAAAARGKLMNFRAANAIFDDAKRSDDDPAANTAEFISHFDEYRARGLLAYTISLQGGSPGYEGALASAFQPDGSLKQAWLDRAAQVIEAADARGQVVILTFFYQRQDQLLRDDAAVRAATVNATDWLIGRGYRNVIIEIANEYDSPLYNQPLIAENQAVSGLAELVMLAKSRFAGLDYRLPVSASARDLDFSGALREAADLALIHGNLTSPAEDALAAAALVADPTVHGPVVMNEDFNGFDPTPRNLRAETETATDVFLAGASWGLMWQTYNQSYPFRWALESTADADSSLRATYFRAVLGHIAGLTREGLPPVVLGRQPAAGSTVASPSPEIRVDFSKVMDPATLTSASITLAPAGGGPALPAVVTASADNTAARLDTSAPLSAGTAYAVTVSAAATDAAGRPLAAPESWVFTTAAGAGPPTLTKLRQPVDANGGSVSSSATARARGLARAHRARGTRVADAGG